MNQRINYTLLQYHCPDISPKDAANQALPILDEVKAADPGLLVYLLSHSNLLTLAGLRTQSPYCTFSPQVTDERLKRLQDILAPHDLLFIEDFDKYQQTAEQDEKVYSLINKRCLVDMPKVYGFSQDFWVAMQDYTSSDFIEWSNHIQWRMVTAIEGDQRLPEQWLLDWWAPHNLRFGMLLGYPGAAIISGLWLEAIEKQDGTQLPLLTYDLPRDTYNGTAVNFYATPEALQLPEVAKLAKLWEAVILHINRQYPASIMMANNDFASELSAYETWDNRFNSASIQEVVE